MFFLILGVWANPSPKDEKGEAQGGCGPSKVTGLDGDSAWLSPAPPRWLQGPSAHTPVVPEAGV